MPQRKPRQQLRAQRTRRHLLVAAGDVFARDGYVGATVDDIARAAGCSKGAYYFHFASKEDVLLALVDDWTRSLSRRLEEASDGGHRPDAALIGLLETLFSSETTEGRRARLLLEFWSQGERNRRVGRRLAQAHRSWRRLLARAFGRAQQAGVFAPDGAPESDADAALALHHGLVVQSSLGLPTGAAPRARAGAAVSLLAGPWTLRPAKTRGHRPSRAAG